MYFYHDYRPAMKRRNQPQLHEPHAGKRRLLRKVLSLQRRKLAAAEAQGDTADAEAIGRRMQQVEMLLADLETSS